MLRWILGHLRVNSIPTNAIARPSNELSTPHVRKLGQCLPSPHTEAQRLSRAEGAASTSSLLAAVLIQCSEFTTLHEWILSTPHSTIRVLGSPIQRQYLFPRLVQVANPYPTKYEKLTKIHRIVKLPPCVLDVLFGRTLRSPHSRQSCDPMAPRARLTSRSGCRSYSSSSLHLHNRPAGTYIRRSQVIKRLERQV